MKFTNFNNELNIILQQLKTVNPTQQCIHEQCTKTPAYLCKITLYGMPLTLFLCEHHANELQQREYLKLKRKARNGNVWDANDFKLL